MQGSAAPCRINGGTVQQGRQGHWKCQGAPGDAKGRQARQARQGRWGHQAVTGFLLSDGGLGIRPLLRIHVFHGDTVQASNQALSRPPPGAI